MQAGGQPVKDIEKWFLAESARSPAFRHLLPEKLWRRWLTENAERKERGESPLPLQLAGFAPIRAISIDASKTRFFNPASLAAHGTRGAKNPIERNVALELYEVPPLRPGGKSKVLGRPKLHPRFAAMQQRWRDLGYEVPDLDPLPEGARLLFCITKERPLCLPLTRDGEIADAWDSAYKRLWVSVTAIKESGKIEMRPVEFLQSELETDKAGYVSRPGSRLFGTKIKEVYTLQGQSLLALMQLNLQLAKS
jgi:hypothetical protein